MTKEVRIEMRTEEIGTGLREGDFVYVTNDAARELPYLAKNIRQGGVIKNVRDGVAEIHVTTVVKVHVSKLTTGDNAYRPTP